MYADYPINLINHEDKYEDVMDRDYGNTWVLGAYFHRYTATHAVVGVGHDGEYNGVQTAVCVDCNEPGGDINDDTVFKWNNDDIDPSVLWGNNMEGYYKPGVETMYVNTCISTEDGVLVEWLTQGEDTDCIGFNVYRSDYEDGQYVKLNTNPIPSEGYGDNEYAYLDTTTLYDGSYYYLVADVDQYEGETFWGTLGGEPAYNYPGMENQPRGSKPSPLCSYDPPANLQAVDHPNDDGSAIDLSWQTVAGADGYQIYRCEGIPQLQGFNLVDTITDYTINQYTDNSVEERQLYNYIIRSYEEDAYGYRWNSENSNEVEVTPEDNLYYGGHITQDTTFSGYITVDSDLVVDAGVTLTIDPGTTIEFMSTDGANLGVDANRIELINHGVIQAGSGALTKFKASLLTPDSGVWYGIRNDGTLNLNSGLIQNAYYAIENEGIINIEEAHISCNQVGLVLSGSGSVSDSFISSCTIGVELSISSNEVLQNNTIAFNSGWGIESYSSTANAGTETDLGRNVFFENESGDILAHTGVQFSACGNQFTSIESSYIDDAVEGEVALKPLICVTDITSGDPFNYGPNGLPRFLVDKDVLVARDLEAYVPSGGYGQSAPFELVIAPGVRIGCLAEEENYVVDPNDPSTVEITIDVPLTIEEMPQGIAGRTEFGLSSWGGVVPGLDDCWGGIAFTEGCTALSVADTVFETTRDGVLVNSPSLFGDDRAEFERVTFADSQNNGLVAAGCDLWFEDCLFTDNAESGLYLETGAWAGLDGCEITDNAQHGIYLSTGASGDLGSTTGSGWRLGRNFFNNNGFQGGGGMQVGRDLFNNSGTPIEAHGNRWGECDWYAVLDYSIHNPGGEDAAHLEPLAWSGDIEAGDTAELCTWVGDVLLLGDVTVGDGIVGPGNVFTLKLSDDDCDGSIQIGLLPNQDREAGGEDAEITEFHLTEVLELDTQLGSEVNEVRFERADNLEYTFDSLPSPEAGEWTGVLVDSYLVTDLQDLNVELAETGLICRGNGLDSVGLHGLTIEECNTGIKCENGAQPEIYDSTIRVRQVGLHNSTGSCPDLIPPQGEVAATFCMDLVQGAVPPKYYIDNDNTFPPPVDATQCVWRDYADENDIIPDSWMFSGAVIYQALLSNLTDQTSSLERSEKLAAGAQGTHLGATQKSISAFRLASIDRVTPEVSTSAPGTSSPAVAATSVLSVVPNPADYTITIHFTSNGAGAEVSIYDLAGRLIDTLRTGGAAVGRHQIGYDVSHLSAGIYLIRLVDGDESTTEKLLISR